MDRSQKLMNPFVPETKESTCICVCNCITVVIDIIMAVQHVNPSRQLDAVCEENSTTMQFILTEI